MLDPVSQGCHFRLERHPPTSPHRCVSRHFSHDLLTRVGRPEAYSSFQKGSGLTAYLSSGTFSSCRLDERRTPSPKYTFKANQDFILRSRCFNAIVFVWEEIVPFLDGGFPTMAIQGCYGDLARYPFTWMVLFTPRSNGEKPLRAQSLLEKLENCSAEIQNRGTPVGWSLRMNFQWRSSQSRSVIVSRSPGGQHTTR